MHLIEIVGLPSLLVLGFFEILKSFNSIQKQNKKELLKQRLNMQMVFQDPYGSLNPVMQLFDQVAEPLLNYKMARGKELNQKASDETITNSGIDGSSGRHGNQ